MYIWRYFIQATRLINFIMVKYLKNLFCSRTDWASAKTLLGDGNFLKRLYEYDKDNIPESMLKKLKKYIENPKFTPDQVEKVSKVQKWPLFRFTELSMVLCTINNPQSSPDFWCDIAMIV